ncbi:DNA/RNA non-specific endonuclease [Porphyromonas sp. COT-239 OH1446]|uniref:DNA/RNA non-specific endonuclease n=1 Tax=Porphyromonas sp. COT-239 OH1446 TaxID=1515613 RepID=UPI00052BE2A6|nr:DNA/RNA non-specific endonuclease [Porphyromonas sp. COT-239 OH1446]KGN70279.1 hypothetical protein HQ37_04365 [Porphyromonas sp. COT-239 OH1446]
MKHLFSRLLVSLLALALLASCDPKSKPDIPGPDGPLVVQFLGSEADKKVSPAGGDAFFVRVSASSPWRMKIAPEGAAAWVKADRIEGGIGAEQSIAIVLERNEGGLRTAELHFASGSETKVLKIEQTSGKHIQGDAARIEVPKLNEADGNYFVSHYSEGVVNFSLEYDVQRRHPRWVALTFDPITSARNYPKRTDAWAWDPKVPEEYATGFDNKDHWFRGTGFSRGHMVASSDRYYSREANEQTFYYTNMSPQRQDHNAGVWSRLEQKVQDWGRDGAFREVLYVAKGGTIRDDQVEPKRIRGKMVVPKHYWMALLLKRGDLYKAIAFWTDHKKYPALLELSSLAISIDELEQRTGLDLFHNLEDRLEERVEAEAPEASFWPGL